MSLLERIDQPSDLRGLSQAELTQLAAEIRQVLVQTVAQTGGHLAPNLGVVELTIALHLAFDSPHDQIIWDVGHQSYVHKLLTGRRTAFASLRQYGGLAGFPKRSESQHDLFETGHSSTALSAALGFAIARDLAGRDNQVVAVVGDGAMTAGMAFEALNQIGHLGKHVICVLNDNEMSIAKNVGAMARYLSRLRMDRTYNRAKEDVESVLRRIPTVGPGMARLAERLKDSLKYLLVPGVLFEELGWSYFGPFDGHDIPALTEAFREAARFEGPVLIHVLTQKGRGYVPAENDAARFHGTGPFAVESGEALSHPDKPSYTQVFGRTLTLLAGRNPRVVALTAAMPEGTGLSEFAGAFPDRFYDVGIAEQHGATLAAGLRPVFAVYSTFLQRAFDQVVHDIALQNLPVVLAVDRGGLVGEDGPTHHGAFDLSYLSHIPNLAVMAPRDERELQQMLATALASPGPVALRYPRASGEGLPLYGAGLPLGAEGDGIPHLPWGRGEVRRRDPEARVALVAVGTMVKVAEEAAALLAREGVPSLVVNARFVRPLDEDLVLEVAGTTGAVVTLEENTVRGGFGSLVLETLSRHGRAGVRTLLLGLPDEFVTHGPRNKLLEVVGLTPEAVARRVAAWVKRGRA
ncbi:MAG TPA: 1-deoxy-D-xylulose-5-phosphate synthase [Firmicutes bacterium]|nr:1-deoxy-D-xylulose-5-phosphate synthase [Bacillota bacterium]